MNHNISSSWIFLLSATFLCFLPASLLASEDDIDNDGVVNTLDNCMEIPNGPSLGTCYLGTNHGVICTSILTCGKGSSCNMDQNDNDGDGVGNVCDNCPETPNGPDAGTCVLGDRDGMSCSSQEECGGGFCSHDQEDLDGDGIGAACDSDRDGDGIMDSSDNCPSHPNGPDLGTCLSGTSEGQHCTDDLACGKAVTCSMNQEDGDSDGTGDACEIFMDTDSDGVNDLDDNCPETPNGPSLGTCVAGGTTGTCLEDEECSGGFCSYQQEDFDGDGIGAACDEDHDGDRWPDEMDNCPYVPNPDQADSDHDTFGNVCDNCPTHYNPGQENHDNDLYGDVCDSCTDYDGDGFGDPGFDNSCPEDNCPMISNPDQADGDEDGAGDACDVCPYLYNPDQEDQDHDRRGDLCDNCIDTPNTGQEDMDTDGVGDACDNCPATPNGPRAGTCLYPFDGVNIAKRPLNIGGTCPHTGYCVIYEDRDSICEQSQADSDHDGVGDVCDNCPGIPNGAQKGWCVRNHGYDGFITEGECMYDEQCHEGMHCSLNQEDLDGDEVGEACDNCEAFMNADQKDWDGDEIGDACDCFDGFMGPNEAGADCGGICPSECPSDCIPLIHNGDSRDKMDIFIIPSTEYANMADFRADAIDVVSKGYLGLPRIAEKREVFNFWYVTEPVQVNNDSGNCHWENPESIKEMCPQLDRAAIIHIDTCRDYSLGDTFSAEFNSYGTFLHESGHGIFGLADEYDDGPDCRTHYFEPDPFPNIYDSEGHCRFMSTHRGNCTLFTTCDSNATKEGWWKSEPNDSIMNGHCPDGYPGTICDFGPDGQIQVDRILEKLQEAGEPIPKGEDERAALAATFSYDGTNLELIRAVAVSGTPPTRHLERHGLKFQIYDFMDQPIESFTIEDPLYKHYDYPLGAETLDRATFTVVFPMPIDMRRVEAGDVRTGQQITSLDFLEVIADFCILNPGHAACPSDQDSDGLPDRWEMLIVDADPDDGIHTAEDVLPTDDFDGDGFNNLREFQGESNPADSSDIPLPATIHVNGASHSTMENGSLMHPFHTIQRGIDHAGPGDRIEVAPGTYSGAGNRDLRIPADRGICLVSSGGAAATVIDCGSESRGITVSYGDKATLISGFTVKNGLTNWGAGIYIRGTGRVEVENSLFTSNHANLGGGAVGIYDAKPTFINCSFTSNSGGKNGGAVHVEYGGITLEGCTFTENISHKDELGQYGKGGALHAHLNSEVTIRRSLFTANQAETQGGAISAESSKITVVSSYLNGNIANENGGAIDMEDSSSLHVYNTAFLGNAAGTNAGAVSVESYSSALVSGSIFSGNSAPARAGAIYAEESSAEISFCTLSGNRADYGGGIYEESSTVKLSGTILWGNNADTDGDELGLHSNSILEIRYSDIEGVNGADEIFQYASGNIIDYANTNINMVPVFRDSDGIDNIPGNMDDDLSLSPASPCIDAADSTLLPDDLPDIDSDGITEEALPLDIYRNRRIHNELPDMGAVEFHTKGLLAQYSTGSTAFEAPLLHGFSRECSDTSYNLYEGVCTAPEESPANWTSGMFSTTWRGYLYAPVSGIYSFSSHYWVDGMVFVKVGDKVIADMNTGGGGYGSTLYLKGGSFVPLDISFESNGGTNYFSFGWKMPGISEWHPVTSPYLVTVPFGIYDLDTDCDVDGSDLAAYIQGPEPETEEFASRFGDDLCTERDEAQ